MKTKNYPTNTRNTTPDGEGFNALPIAFVNMSLGKDTVRAASTPVRDGKPCLYINKRI